MITATIGDISLTAEEVLFIGLGTSPVMYYRCLLPATHLGADWVGVYGEPPGLEVATGRVKGFTQMPKFEDYRCVIMQQPRGTKWLKLMKRLQREGITVLYEVDDYLHGVRKQEHHDYAEHFDKRFLADSEMCMRAADGLVCSTEYLAKRYRAFNKRAWVAENGLDLARYRLTRLERETCSIGWAGATGHLGTLMDWLGAVATLMLDHDHVNFVSVGQPALAQAFGERFGARRALGVPFTLVENYPAAMSLFDIALAPAGKTAWYRAKSDLRQLEAGALGIPIIADPVVYPNIEHGVTGFHAETPDEVLELLRTLVDDRGLRQDVGRAAKAYVEEHRDINNICRRWLEVAALAVAGFDSDAVAA